MGLLQTKRDRVTGVLQLALPGRLVRPRVRASFALRGPSPCTVVGHGKPKRYKKKRNGRDLYTGVNHPTGDALRTTEVCVGTILFLYTYKNRYRKGQSVDQSKLITTKGSASTMPSVCRIRFDRKSRPLALFERLCATASDEGLQVGRRLLLFIFTLPHVKNYLEYGSTISYRTTRGNVYFLRD